MRKTSQVGRESGGFGASQNPKGYQGSQESGSDWGTLVLSQERQLLCLSSVVAPSSTGWQACPVFKATSVPTGHLEESLESLCWEEHFHSSSHAFLHSPSPPRPLRLPGMLTSSHFLRKSWYCNSPHHETGMGLTQHFTCLISYYSTPRHRFQGYTHFRAEETEAQGGQGTCTPGGETQV